MPKPKDSLCWQIGYSTGIAYFPAVVNETQLDSMAWIPLAVASGRVYAVMVNGFLPLQIRPRMGSKGDSGWVGKDRIGIMDWRLGRAGGWIGTMKSAYLTAVVPAKP